jgi:hypothetical protein
VKEAARRRCGGLSVRHKHQGLLDLVATDAREVHGALAGSQVRPRISDSRLSHLACSESIEKAPACLVPVKEHPIAAEPGLRVE